MKGAILFVLHGRLVNFKDFGTPCTIPDTESI